MEKDRIIDKIKKCLALSASDSPNEAATALRQAQALMVKHNIDMGGIALADIDRGYVRSTASSTKVKPYELALVNAVVGAFGCALMWREGMSWSNVADEVYGKFIIIGPKSQVEIAVHTAVVLTRRLAKARAAYLNKECDDGSSRARKTVMGNGFCDGWVVEIRKTIIAYTQTSEVTTAIEAYKKLHLNPGGKAKSATRGSSLDSFHDGRDAAKGESLYRPMNQEKKTYLPSVI